MKCRNCQTETNAKFCPNCGNKMRYKSFSSIVSIITTILITVALLFYGIRYFNGMLATTTTQEEKDSAIFLFSLLGGMVAFLVITYYFTVTTISIAIDHKKGEKSLLKNIIVIIFLLVPFIIAGWIARLPIIASFEKSIEMKDMIFKFDELKPIDGDYEGKKNDVKNMTIKNSKNDPDCRIEFGRYDIVNGKSLQEFLKDKYSVHEDTYNGSLILENKTIKNKEWSFFIKEENIYYSIYGIELNNSFYIVESFAKDNNTSYCKKETEKVLNSVEYK